MKKILLWILSGFFALTSLVYLTGGGFVAGVLALLVAALFMPAPTWQNIISPYIKGKWKVFLSIALVIGFLVAVPTEDTVETGGDNPTDKTESEIVRGAKESEGNTTLDLVEIETLESSADAVSATEESSTEAYDTTEAESSTKYTESVVTTQATTGHMEASTEADITVATETYATEVTTAATTHNTEPTYTQATTVPTETTTVATESNGRNFVINTNTEKFHHPSCSSVKDISPENRWDYYGTREAVIDMGYVPCKRCDP